MPATLANTAITLPEGPLAAVFLDLDDSIFQTLRKCSPGPLEAAAMDREGRPSSYFSFGQRCLLELLSGRALLIPTTARNQEAFNRVGFAFRHGAILNYGGMVLRPDGQIDQGWQDQMKPLCAEAKPLLAALLAASEQIIQNHGMNCRARIIGDHGLDFYVVIKNYNSRLEELSLIMQELKKMAFSAEAIICINDNNLSLRPLFLDKSAAMAYFVKTHITPEHSALPMIGLGDSFSDLEFMKRCDFLLIPSGSQIASLLSSTREEGA